jgi:hypothetical protein
VGAENPNWIADQDFWVSIWILSHRRLPNAGRRSLGKYRRFFLAHRPWSVRRMRFSAPTGGGRRFGAFDRKRPARIPSKPRNQVPRYWSTRLPRRPQRRPQTVRLDRHRRVDHRESRTRPRRPPASVRSMTRHCTRTCSRCPAHHSITRSRRGRPSNRFESRLLNRVSAVGSPTLPCSAHFHLRGSGRVLPWRHFFENGPCPVTSKCK